MDLLSFLLEDHRCPHCAASLRWRLVKTVRLGRAAPPGQASSHEQCPLCLGAIELREHPAVNDDWRWAKLLAPGILVWIVAIPLGLPPPLTLGGTALLLGGFVLLLRYMVAQRWRRRRFVAFGPAQGGPHDHGA